MNPIEPGHNPKRRLRRILTSGLAIFAGLLPLGGC